MDSTFWYKLIMTGILFITAFAAFWQTLKFERIRPGNVLFGVELPAVRLDSEEAVSIKGQYKRDAVLFLVAFIIISVIFWLIPVSSEHMLVTFICIAIAACFFMHIPYIIANSRLRAVKKDKSWYATSEAEDGDKYWLGGIIYYNKYDPQTRVVSRLNQKKTFNLATRRGRSFAIILVVLLVVAVWYAIGSIGYENALVPEMIFHPDGLIEIDSTYGQEFSASDIVEVSLVDTVPVKMRIVGTSTDKFRRGTFEVEGCPKSTLYIFNEIEPYIKIQLKDKYIFFNYPTPEATDAAYQRLLSAMPKKEAVA